MSRIGSARPGAGDHAAVATILPIIERLGAAVEAENSEIESHRSVDYRAHTQRKNQGLYELQRLTGLVVEAHSHPAVQNAFAVLAARLEKNHRLLGAQLRAAQKVSDIVTRAIRDNQSDGTYSAHPWRDQSP